MLVCKQILSDNYRQLLILLASSSFAAGHGDAKPTSQIKAQWRKSV